MASADSCRSIPTRRRAGSSWQTDRSPGVRCVTFAAYARRIYAAAFRMTSGFESSRPLAHATPPRMRLLFVGPQLCLQLPSDPASRRQPLLFG
jgi:hypothetical protein